MSSSTAMSQPSVSRAMTQICRLISEILMPLFYEKTNFRDVIICLTVTDDENGIITSKNNIFGQMTHLLFKY